MMAHRWRPLRAATLAAAVWLGLPDVAEAVPTVTTLRLLQNPVVEGTLFYAVAEVTPMAPYIGYVDLYVDGVYHSSASVNPIQIVLSVYGLSVGTHDLQARFLGGGGFDPSTSDPVRVTILEFAPHTQYFAEGATGTFFQTGIGVLNVNRTNAAHVTATFYPESGPPVVRTFTLAPLTRRSIDVNAVVGSHAGVSALIAADAGIAATRQMTWGDPVYGSTLESGAREASPTWYFAEGAAGLFSTFYMVHNPNDTAATVTLTHVLDGAAPVVQVETVPAFARRTLAMSDVPGLRRAAFATTVSSTLPIVAERAMYVHSDVRVFEGGTAAHGATALSHHWRFAEGVTGFFRTYLIIGNPSPTAGVANVRYQLPDGTIIYKLHDLPAQSRVTIDVGTEDPRLASTVMAFDVDASPPIVAERSIWWGLPFYEGSTALGTPTAVIADAEGYAWAVGEAAEGGPDGDATFVLVENRRGNQGRVRVTLVYDDATNEQKDYPLPTDNRLTLRIGDAFPRAAGQRFSVLVESLDTVPITVECARYQSAGGFLSGGGVTSTTRVK